MIILMGLDWAKIILYLGVEATPNFSHQRNNLVKRPISLIENNILVNFPEV